MKMRSKRSVGDAAADASDAADAYSDSG